jgi:hypothetical protein
MFRTARRPALAVLEQDRFVSRTWRLTPARASSPSARHRAARCGGLEQKAKAQLEALEKANATEPVAVGSVR